MRDSYDEEIVCVCVWRMKVIEMLIKGYVERYRDDNDSVYMETEVNRESSKNGIHTKQYRAIIIQSLKHISEPTRIRGIAYAVLRLEKKKRVWHAM